MQVGPLTDECLFINSGLVNMVSHISVALSHSGSLFQRWSSQKTSVQRGCA